VTASYGVRISARAERELLRLPEKIGAACLTFIFGPLTGQPYRLGGALRGQLTGLYSTRRGSYRIVYRIDDEANRIDIILIDHRRHVYR